MIHYWIKQLKELMEKQMLLQYNWNVTFQLFWLDCWINNTPHEDVTARAKHVISEGGQNDRPLALTNTAAYTGTLPVNMVLPQYNR